MKPVINKVFAYVTWTDQFAVFDHADHPDVCTQVPAGTVEPDESVRDAALREATEETGQPDLEMVRRLGVTEVDAEDADGTAVIHRRHFWHIACTDEPPATWTHEETDPHTGGGPKRFAFRWESVDSPPPLCPGHDAMLDRLRDSLEGCTPAFDALTADRETFLAEWAASRAELDAELDGLLDADLEESGMTGAWSGRQTLIHIARWDETTTEMILRLHLGVLAGVSEYDDYEWWNLRWAEIDADIPLENAWQRYHASHEAIVRTLSSFPDNAWTEAIRGWVREASLEHYRHHAATIREWRAHR